jgi:hypothetical protein
MRIQLGIAAAVLVFASHAAFAQFAQQGPKLRGSAAVGEANQGQVAISADGNTAIVGGFVDNGGVGAAWIWSQSGGVWTQQGTKLVGSDAVGQSQQGASVAISADGNTAVVGGPSDNPSNANGTTGAAWIWTRSGGVWTQQGPKLVGSDALGNAGQGRSVAISADGNTVIIGGPEDDFTGVEGMGAAWVWTRSGGTWTQQGKKLVGSGAASRSAQGVSVALSSDGNTAIVGGDEDNDNGAGAVWVWTRTGDVWTQQGSKLVGSGGAGQTNQGSSVALSSDGNTAIVGGQSDHSFLGAAWVWTRNGGVWTQQGPKLVGSGTANSEAEQGTSVSLSSDGNTALIGAIYDDNGTGAGWVWTRSANVWSQQGTKLVAPVATGSVPLQGISVSLAGDGNTAIIGGYQDDHGTGAAWIWTRSASAWSQRSKLVGSGAEGGIGQGCSVALSADGSTAIVGGSNDNGAQGAAWVWTRNAGAWTQQGNKLVGADAEGGAAQGASVTISSDGNTAIVGGPWDDDNAGAIWVWTRSNGVWSQQGPKLVGSAAVGKGQQGTAVAVSADGNTAVVGGPGSPINYSSSPFEPPDISSAGGAWIWTRSGDVWTEVTRLTAPDASIVARQGIAVAISADGNTALVGGETGAWVWTKAGGSWSQQGTNLTGTYSTAVALSADGNTAVLGGYAASVWTRSGVVWTKRADLKGLGADGEAYQGMSVSLSADGKTAAIGGPYDHAVPFRYSHRNTSPYDRYSGAVWVWTRSGDTWTQTGTKLIGSDGDFADQGSSVAISFDGRTLIVGGPHDGSTVGAAWVFGAGVAVDVPGRRHSVRH